MRHFETIVFFVIAILLMIVLCVGSKADVVTKAVSERQASIAQEIKSENENIANWTAAIDRSRAKIADLMSEQGEFQKVDKVTVSLKSVEIDKGIYGK